MAENIHFPKVSFDWLAELPQIAEQAQEKRMLKDTLADLKSSDPGALERKAAQLFSQGMIDQGMKLQNAATARRALSQRGAQDALMMEWLKNSQNRAAPGALPAASGGDESTVDIPLRSGPAPAAAPSPFGPNPLSSGPQSSAPPVEPPVPVAQAPESPSNQMITAAQRGTEVRPQSGGPQPQLAGPLPQPDTPPAAPAQPSWLPAAQAQPMTTPPSAPRPPPNYGPVGVDPGQAEARAEVARIGQTLAGMPPKVAQSGEGRALLQQFNSALTRLKVDPKERDYQLARIQRAQAGEPDFSRAEHDFEKTVAPKRFEEFQKTYTKYADEEKEGRKLGQTTYRLGEILRNDKFAAGAPGYLDMAKRGISSFADTLRAHGVPEAILPSRETLAAMNEPTALRELFTSLANQGVISALGGSLGRGISSTDQVFMSKAFPDLMKTREGSQLIVDFMDELASRKRLGAEAVRKYGKDVGDFKASPMGADAAANRALEEQTSKPILVKSDGKPTELGQKIAAELAKLPKVTAPVQAAPPAQAAPSGPRKRVIGPKGEYYTQDPTTGALVPVAPTPGGI